MYYLQSRYYNPTWGRFINADALVSTGQGILGNNMFAYCANNPVNYIDHLGTYGICVLNDPMNVNRAFMMPGMFGGGGGGGYGVADVSSTYYASQNVKNYDNWWRNSDYNMPSSGWGNSVKQSPVGENNTDFYVTPKGEAIPATVDGFNGNLSKLENRNGKYVGSDSYGPIRIRAYEIHDANPNYTGMPNPYHTILHFHIDRRAGGEVGAWGSTYTGAMEMLR